MILDRGFNDESPQPCMKEMRGFYPLEIAVMGKSYRKGVRFITFNF